MSYKPIIHEWTMIKRIYISYKNKKILDYFYMKFIYRKYFLVIEYHDNHIERFDISYSEKEKIKKKIDLLNQFINHFVTMYK